MGKIEFKIREIAKEDEGWVKKFIIQNWGSERIISRGKIYFPHELSGFALLISKWIGTLNMFNFYLSFKNSHQTFKKL